MQLIEGLSCISKNPDHIWKNLPKKERKKLLEYRGIDSHTWFWVEKFQEELQVNSLDLVSLKDIVKVKQYLGKILKKHPYSYVIFLTNDLSKVVAPENLMLIGYDVGVSMEYNEPLFFSGIFNEIRLTGNSDLKILSDKLNQYYLFDNANDGNSYINIRKKMFRNNNFDLIETAYETEMMQVFKIYLLN